MKYILIIMSFCVLWSSARERLSSEIIYPNKNDVPKGSTQHCFCYTRNSSFDLVRDRINQNKNSLKRLVAYFYINEYTNRVSMYIPNQDIQNVMPDINYNDDDIISDITDGFSVNFIVKNPYTVRYNGTELTLSDSTIFNNETSNAADFPTKNESIESINKYPYETEYLKDEDRGTQKYYDTTEDFSNKYLPHSWDNTNNNNNIININGNNHNNKASMWLPHSDKPFGGPNYEEAIYRPQNWQNKWPNHSSVTQNSDNFDSEGEYYHKGPEIENPQHKYLDPYNSITNTEKEFPYLHSKYPNRDQLTDYFVPQQHVAVNSDAGKLFKNQYNRKIQKTIESNDEYPQYAGDIIPSAAWISKLEYEPTKNKDKFSHAQFQYSKWRNKFDEDQFEPSVTTYERKIFPNDKHNRPTDMEIKFINQDPQTLESNRYNLVNPIYSKNTQQQEAFWPQKHSLSQNSLTQFWPNKLDEDNKKSSDTYFKNIKRLNDKYNIPTDTEFELIHSEPLAPKDNRSNLVTPTYLNNSQHPKALWPQKNPFYSQNQHYILPERHQDENKYNRPQFLEDMEEKSETVTDSSTKMTVVTLDKLKRDKFQNKPNNSNLHNKNPSYLEHQFAEAFGFFNSSLLKHIQNISRNYNETFDTWYNKEFKCVKSNLQMVAAIDMSELKLKLRETLAQNGITVSDNGVLEDSKGVIINLNNLKLQPVLIGNAFSFDKFMSFIKVHRRVGLPPSFYLQAVIITIENPMKILGIVPLGVLNLSKQIPIQILESQYPISEGKDPQSYMAINQNTLAIAQTKDDRIPNYVGNTRSRYIYVPQNNVASVLKHFYENYDKRNYNKITDYSKLDDIYELKNIKQHQKLRNSDFMPSYRIIGGNTATGSGRPISNRGRSGRRNLDS